MDPGQDAFLRSAGGERVLSTYIDAGSNHRAHTRYLPTRTPVAGVSEHLRGHGGFPFPAHSFQSILAAAGDVKPIFLHFIFYSDATSIEHITEGLGRLSVTVAGRTLLLEASQHGYCAPFASPNTEIPGLYHRTVNKTWLTRACCGNNPYGECELNAFTISILMSLHTDHGDLPLLPISCSTVLLVERGNLPVASMRATIASFKQRGVNPLGCVMIDTGVWPRQ